MLSIVRRQTLKLVGLAGLAVALAGAPAAAQELPFEGPVTIIAGYPAGGTSDALARTVAAELEKKLGRSVVVENKTGAGGRVAVQELMNSPADGSVLLVGNIVMMVLAPLTFSDIGYDPLTDLAPVTKATDYAIVLATGAMTGAQDLESLLAWLRENPDQASYGVPAAGSLPHLFGVQLAETTGLPLNMVAFRGGAPIATALVGGQVAAGISAPGDFGELHKAGKLKIVAASGTQRGPGLEDVPTFAELGHEGFEENGWNGFFAPKGTPAEVVDIYNKAIVEILADPAVVKKLEEFGFIVTSSTPEELHALIESGRKKWGPLIEAAGVKQ